MRYTPGQTGRDACTTDLRALLIRMTTLTVNLPDKVVAGIDRAAKARRKSRAAFVREVLAESAQAAGATASPSLLDRTKNLCGIGFSKVGDLSSNPEHLADFGR